MLPIRSQAFQPFALAVAALAALCLLAACGGSSEPRSQRSRGGQDLREERLFLTPVLVETARRGEIRSTISATGSIVPSRSFALRVEEAGRIFFEREWQEGDAVADGELIARIESPALERELELNERDIEIQRENLRLGERTLRSRLNEYRTLQELFSKGIAPRRDVDAMRLQLDQAVNTQRQNEINLAKAEAQREETLSRKARLEIRSPYDGVLVSRATLAGEGRFTQGFGSEAITDTHDRQVSTGQVVCGVVDIRTVFMRCDVTAKDLASVHEGQEADVVVFARRDVAKAGRIARISRSVNPDTRAFEVDIHLANEDGALRPGMFGRAEIVVERRFDTIAVDKATITRRNNQDVAFVAIADPETGFEVARMVPVELGLEGRERIEVLTGLRTGDRVITRNFEVLQDNTRISTIDVDEPLRPGEPEDRRGLEEPEEPPLEAAGTG